jgi:two-component system sensor histidine kinase ChvG
MHRQPLWRFCTRTIGHRIFAANLVGFIILTIGLLLLSQGNRWLVDAKVESLTAQARLIAAAIAANAKVETGQITFDPDSNPASDPWRPVFEDAFADIRLSIAPEKVAPILAKLVPAGDARVRIYNPNGFLIIDSNQRLQRGQIARTPVDASKATRPREEELSDLWTWFLSLFIRSDMAVYREVGAEQASYPEIEAALRGETTRMLLVNRKVEQIVAVAAPVQSVDGIRGAVFLTSRPGDIDNLLDRQRRALLVLTGIALITALFASWLLRRTIAGPMHRLSAAAEAVTRSINAQRELPEFPGRRDEIGTLAQSFREMTESLYRRIERSDRFAQDVAHELKNPVAAARATAESLRFAKTDAQREEMVTQVTHELKRLNRLITDISKAQRLEAELALQETEPIDMAELARGVASTLDSLHRDAERPVRVQVAVGAGAGQRGAFVLRGNELRLSQVLTNLIDNAVSFSPPHAVVEVRLERRGDEVICTVEDQGPGIPEGSLESVFKRFYSDRPQSDRTAGKNSGLGLAISRDIVLAHAGRIFAENRMAVAGVPVGVNELPELAERRLPGVAGTRFTIVLPALGSGAGPSQSL